MQYVSCIMYHVQSTIWNGCVNTQGACLYGFWLRARMHGMQRCSVEDKNVGGLNIHAHTSQDIHTKTLHNIFILIMILHQAALGEIQAYQARRAVYAYVSRYYTVLIVLYCIVLYCIVLYCIRLHCIRLYIIIFQCIIFYSTILMYSCLGVAWTWTWTRGLIVQLEMTGRRGNDL